jgi:hypothetical protein
VSDDLLIFGVAAPTGALLGTVVGFLEATGLALDGDELGIMDKTVDQRDAACGVGETRRAIRRTGGSGDQRARVQIARRDQLEHQVGVAIGIGEIANPVDDEQLWTGVPAQAAA